MQESGSKNLLNGSNIWPSNSKCPGDIVFMSTRGHNACDLCSLTTKIKSLQVCLCHIRGVFLPRDRVHKERWTDGLVKT